MSCPAPSAPVRQLSGCGCTAAASGQGRTAAALAAGLFVFLAFLTPTALRAQGAGPGAGAALEIPGGTGALAAVLGIAPDAPHARILLTAIRVMWEVPEGQDPARDRRRAEVRGYLETVAAFERARAGVGPAPAALALAADTQRRGAVRDLALALGGELIEGRTAWQIKPVDQAAAVRRRAWLATAGVPVDTLVTRLNAGEAVPLEWRSDTVPLPFPPAVWRRVLKPPESLRGPLFAAILGDRRAALLYYGTAALDSETRAFILADPTLVGVLYNDLPSATMALCGRSLHVAAGRVVVPGGEAAAPLWEAVVGAPLADTRAFIAWLFSRDDGRVALLYDAIAHLDASAQRFALGLDVPDAGLRRDRFLELCRVAAVPLGGWSPLMRPFERVVFDVPHLLSRMRTGAETRPAGPLQARFWNSAFASADIPAADADLLQHLDTGDVLDAAALLGLIAVADTAARRDRAEAWMFAQRVFPSPGIPTLPDVLVAVRGMARYRTLVLSLERMGVSDPRTYAVAVRAAAELSHVERRQVWTAMAQFQGALAVVERARFARAIDPTGADRLVRALCAVPLTQDREYFGGIAAWIEQDLRPAFGAVATRPPPVDPDRPIETHVLAIMAGAVHSSPYGDVASMPTVDWEGLPYRIDPASATLRRLIEVRRKQGGHSLDAVLALARAAEAVVSMTDSGQAEAHVAALVSAVAGLQVADPVADARRPSATPNLDSALAEARRRLQDVSQRPRAEDLSRAVRALRRAAEWHLARVLASLAYAPHLGEPDSMALIGGDPSVAHDFRVDESRSDTRIRAMWSLPEERRDPTIGWRVAGSLLGLDVTLARFALRRVASEVMPAPPMLSDIERQAITEPVVLTSPFDQTDVNRDTLVAALRKGRARVADAASSPDAVVRLAQEAGLDEWRVRMVPWLVAHEPARLTDEWSLGEFVRLGTASRGSEFDAWGVSGVSGDGNLTSAFPWRLPWTTLAGRKSSRLVAGLVPDLMIALAETLADLHLPARLSAGVLSVATQDLLDSLRTNHDDDWLALVTQSKAVTVGRVEDYVAALTIGGPLVPADMERERALEQMPGSSPRPAGQGFEQKDHHNDDVR